MGGDETQITDMNKKTIWVVVLAVILVILIIRGINSSRQVATTDEPIKIGVVNSLTGFAAPWGEFAKKAVDLAAKEINAGGGINGRQIQIVMEDDHTDGKTSVTAYNKLVSVDGVDGVLGGVFDFTALPLIPLAETNKTTLITPQNFRIPGSFDLNDQSFVMMTDFSAVLERLKLFISESKAKKVAVVHFTSAWGAEIAKTVGSISREVGKGAIMDEAYSQLGNNDFKTTISKLKSAGIELVFIDMFGNDTVSFLNRAREQGFNPTVITYNGALDGVENKNGLLDNIVVINWEIAGPNFQELFKAEYGMLPQKSAEKWFDATYAMAYAIANATSTSGVAAYMQTHPITTPNSTVIFTDVHTVSDIPVEIDIIKDGKLVKWVKK